MTPNFKFSHSCGHFGISPLHRPESTALNFNSQALTIHATNAPQTTTIQVSIPFQCPFCSNSTSNFYSSIEAPPNLATVPDGAGILCLITCTPPFSPPFHSNFWRWYPLQACVFSEIKLADLDHLIDQNSRGGMFQYLAWIPKPCGAVWIGVEENDVEGNRRAISQTLPTIEVSSAWRQRIRHTGEVGAETQSQFAGLLTQLHAAVLQSERVGEYA